MKTIFENVRLGNLELKNRLVRSATLEAGGAEAGAITPLLEQIYGELAEGGVGLIITGMMGVAPNACFHSGMTKIYEDSFPNRFQAVAERVHRLGGKIVVQLGHCGAKSGELDGGGLALAPSDVEQGGMSARAMTAAEIERLAVDYGIAAQRCREAGADGVQIHAAHGYLLNQFLSPLFNRRTDAYGGPIENRARILFTIYDEIRRRVGADYPVLVKINYSDLAEGGIAEADVLWYCGELDRCGIDAIEVSSGIGIDKASGSIQGGRRDEAFNAPYALKLADELHCAIISVGGYRSPEAVNDVLNRGKLAAVSLSRPLIREPGLPGRWLGGDFEKSDCISCGKCFRVLQHGCFLKRTT